MTDPIYVAPAPLLDEQAEALGGEYVDDLSAPAARLYTDAQIAAIQREAHADLAAAVVRYCDLSASWAEEARAVDLARGYRDVAEKLAKGDPS